MKSINRKLGSNQQPPEAAKLDAELIGHSDGQELLEAARNIEQGLTVEINGRPVDEAYQNALDGCIQDKTNQVEGIENRLEALIDRQQARLQQAQKSKPGFLAMPGKAKAWAAEQARSQGRLNILHSRLENIREIKDGMGLYEPKLEELAIKKLKKEEPELVESWEKAREADKLHRELIRKQEREKQRQEKSRGLKRSLGLSLD